MKEEGIIATSFTIYPKRGEWTGGFEGGGEADEEEGVQVRVGHYFGLMVLFQLNGTFFSQVKVWRGTEKPAAAELQCINNEM